MNSSVKHALPTPVGEEAFFQIPELEQLPVKGYEYVGKGKIVHSRGMTTFHILEYRDKFYVAHYITSSKVEDLLSVLDTALVPFLGNGCLRVIPMEQIPAGDYRIAGEGGIKAHNDVSAVKIYFLEKVWPKDGKYIAVESPVGSLNVGSTIGVARRRKLLSFYVDRSSVGDEQHGLLDENLHPVERSYYRWNGIHFVPGPRFAPAKV